MINFIKNDFRSVHYAMKQITNNKIPTWVVVVYYCLVAPIGFILYPFAKIYVAIRFGKLFKEIKKMEAE